MTTARAGKTVKVRPETRRALCELKQLTGLTYSEIIGLAIENYRRERILRQSNEAYAAMRQEPRR
jgi:hypothetical protein